MEPPVYTIDPGDSISSDWCGTISATRSEEKLEEEESARIALLETLSSRAPAYRPKLRVEPRNVRTKARKTVWRKG